MFYLLNHYIPGSGYEFRLLRKLHSILILPPILTILLCLSDSECNVQVDGENSEVDEDLKQLGTRTEQEWNMWQRSKELRVRMVKKIPGYN